MSLSRVQRVGGGAGGAGLTAAQTTAVNNVSLGDIDDFTGTLHNYWQFGIPNTQSSGTYQVTTYSPSSSGLTMVVSSSETKFNGSGVAKPVGFWRMIHQPDFDIAIDIDSIANQTTFHSDEWHVHLAVCIGSSFRHDSMFAARLENKGSDWTCARVIKPSYQEQWSGGYVDSLDTGLTGFDAGSPPPNVRLRIQHSNANSGYKAFYSLNSGGSYTTLEGSSGGTGFFQMHTKDTGVGGSYNKYAVGGPHCVLVTVGRNNNQASASNQGSCRVKFKDLS